MQRSLRAKLIIQSLRTSGKLSVDQLARLTGASAVTIRRDLAVLEAHGALRRVPGGATRAVRSEEEIPYSLRLTDDVARKTALARAACTLIEDSDTVIIDNGTTCHAAAVELVGRPITAVCLSLHSAMVLGSSPGPRVNIPGGPLVQDTLAMMSGPAIDYLRGVSADVLLLGACAVSPRRGLLADHPEDAALKAAAIESSTRRVLLATAEKLSHASSFRFGAVEDLTHLVTTDDAPDTILGPFRDAGVEVLTV